MMCQRLTADLDHRLRHDARNAAQPQSQPTAEEDDLHRRLSVASSRAAPYP